MSERRMTKRAVVLAAGTGSRLGEAGIDLPKPLRPVGGRPLLVRVLRTLRAVGIEEAVIITGYQGERIRQALTNETALGLDLMYVTNEQYLKKNGVSLLAASAYIDQECILTMSDHLYSPRLVQKLLEPELPEGGCALAVDRNIAGCFDLPDATKVRSENGRIVEIGKEIPTYDALDTGVFRIGPSLLRELALVEAVAGDCSLSCGVQALSRKGQFFAVDVSPVRWIDVDTPEALVQAEKLLQLFGEGLDLPMTEAQAPLSTSTTSTQAPLRTSAE